MERRNELKEEGFLRLANGAPSGDTIRRVVEAVEAVNPAQLRASLDAYREHILESLCNHQIGKKPRGENPTGRDGNGLYILNAWLRPRYATELLKKQTDKLSLKRRRKNCLLNLGYFAQVLKASNFHAFALIFISDFLPIYLECQYVL